VRGLVPGTPALLVLVESARREFTPLKPALFPVYVMCGFLPARAKAASGLRDSYGFIFS